MIRNFWRKNNALDSSDVEQIMDLRTAPSVETTGAINVPQNAEEAVEYFKEILKTKPTDAAVHNNLANAYKELARFEDAVAQYKLALRYDKKNAVIYNNLGIMFAAQDKFEDAQSCYLHAIALKPDFADPHNNLAIIYAGQGGLEAALDHWEQAIILNPQFPEALNNAGNVYRQNGRYADAEKNLKRALSIRPNFADAHFNLGIVYSELGQFDQALSHYSHAIKIKPDHVDAHYNRANIKSFTLNDPDLTALRSLAENESLPYEKRTIVHFALAKGLDESGEYAEAFKHLRSGNQFERSRIQYDEAAEIRRFNNIANVFTKTLFNNFRSSEYSTLTPVFVVGMPRSGSTLIEQILSSHPEVYGAGELSIMEAEVIGFLNSLNPSIQYPECISSLDEDALKEAREVYLRHLEIPDGKTRVIDKMPENFMNIGLIRLMFPHARIIHTMRDSRDTCLSCYSKHFSSGHQYSYDLGELGRHYRRYHKLMNHWREVLPKDTFLDVLYEDVVENLEAQARRLTDFCGLPWDDRCLHYYKNNRPVKTASDVQVRRKIYRNSIGRWKKYETELSPLLSELNDLIVSDTNTDKVNPGTARE